MVTDIQIRWKEHIKIPHTSWSITWHCYIYKKLHNYEYSWTLPPNHWQQVLVTNLYCVIFKTSIRKINAHVSSCMTSQCRLFSGKLTQSTYAFSAASSSANFFFFFSFSDSSSSFVSSVTSSIWLWVIIGDLDTVET